jgi:phytoene dehydrogenase-like protein
MIPDLEYNLRGLFPDLRDPERAETVELPRMFPFEDLSRIPPERLTYGDSPGLSVETPVPNLFVVGDESFPGAGIHGSFDAAKRVLEALAKKEQRQEYSHLISP